MSNTTKMVQSMSISSAQLSTSENTFLHPLYRVAGASVFPHSRQDVCARGVIRPQNGHILCDANPRAGRVADANSVETDAAILASLLRKRSPTRRNCCSISDPLSFCIALAIDLKIMARRNSLFCARLLMPASRPHKPCSGQLSKVSNVDQLSALHWAMMSIERALLLSLSGYLS